MDEVTVVTGADATPPEEEDVLRFGERYRPLALLGSGGMGTVYLARDEELGELVALKVLRNELLDDPSMVERFRDEVRLARRVSSPLVARTHDLAQHDGRWFVTMQYVEGETLTAKLRREGRLPLAVALPLARDMCDALSAVHAAGVVHRDLKPGNVLVSTEGRAVLTDFGIALRAELASHETDGSGTPTYVAPEQLAGRAVDARTDVFSLGALLFTSVTGQRPFSIQRTGAEPAPDARTVAPGVPDGLAELLMRSMAKDPAARFESSAALRSAIDGLALRGTLATRDSAIPGFVRAVGAAQARAVFVASIELVGMAEAVGSAARVDLLARLRAQGTVRVVPAPGDAEAVLTARLTQRGGQVTVFVALHSQRDGYVFSRNSFDGPLVTLPQLIARGAHAIERALSPASSPLCLPEVFPSEEVTRLFLEARMEYRAFGGTHLARSVELFERALKLAPEHPILVAWCASAITRQSFYGADPAESIRGRELAVRAVLVAPDLAEARVALASVYASEMRLTEAIPHFVAALRIAPGLLEQRGQFAQFLHECGAVGPALSLAESTFEADPSFTDPLVVSMRHHGLRGRLDLAAEQLARAPAGKADLGDVSLARYCTWTRDRARFDAQCRRIDTARVPVEGKVILDVQRRLLAGERAPLEELQSFRAGNPRRRAFFDQVSAEIFALAGDPRRALDAIETASELGLYDIHWLDLCALFDPLRGMQRFEAVRHTVHARAMKALAEVERCLAE